MNKESIVQIKNLISDYKERLSLLDKYVHSESFISNYQTIPIPEVVFFLDQINKDVDEIEIPEIYKEILISIVLGLKINLLPKIQEQYNQVPVDEFLKKTVKDVLSKLALVSNQVNSYDFYKSIGFASQNVVIVGANGSGKTSLANTIKDTLRRKEGIVIPAHKQILIPTLTYIPSLDSIKTQFYQTQRNVVDNKITYQLDNNGDLPFNVVQLQNQHVKDLFIMLSAERAAANAKCGNKARNGEIVTKTDAASTIDTVIEVWNELIEHRSLVYNDNGGLVIRNSDSEYPAYMMSDGERLILYLVAEIQLAPQNALIVVDEPELHLHKAILDKLWNKLEKLRSDCLFFYLTHDLQFATSRSAIKCWIKSYDPNRLNKWEIKRVEDNDIPQELMLKLLGSRKNVLFCEGELNSIDYKLYTKLFPNLTVTPVGSCKNVIDYTRAFNKLKDKYSYAFGLIDRDFKSQKELEELKPDNIFSYDVAEVENVLLQEDLLRKMDARLMCHSNIDTIKQEIINKLYSEKEHQASRYVEHQISSSLARINGLRGTNIEEVKANYQKEIDRINPDVWYNERLKVIEQLVADGNYSEVLKVYNNKGIVGIVEHQMSIKRYQDRALELIGEVGVPQSIIDLYPKELM